MGDVPAIVIDNGSGYIKAGFSGEDGPRSVFPTILARDRLPAGAMNTSGTFVGAEAQTRRGPLILSSPVEHGKIVNWDDMERVWHHTFFNELRVDPSNHNVLLTLPPERSSCIELSARMAEIMFERFGVAGVYFDYPASLAFTGSGRRTGLVIDSGHDGTYYMPILDSLICETNARTVDFAGLDLTLYLTKLLNERGFSFKTANDREIVQDIKEKFTYVALDYAIEKESDGASRTAKLPDGTIINLEQDAFACPEALFQPTLIGKTAQGIHDGVRETLRSFPDRLHNDFYRNIVLAGGSTMFPGFQERLTKELAPLAQEGIHVNVIAPPERNLSAWIGGSVQTSRRAFQDMFITREVYDTLGEYIWVLNSNDVVWFPPEDFL